MLHAGLDLSRTRLDYCLLGEDGGRVEAGAVPPDADGLAALGVVWDLRPVPTAAYEEASRR